MIMHDLYIHYCKESKTMNEKKTYAYQKLDDPFRYEKFDNLSKTEALDYLKWYVGQINNRIAVLRDYVKRTTNFEIDLDYSEESLKKIWEWYEERIEVGTISKEEMEENLKKTPRWIWESVMENNYKISSDTLCIAYDLGLYLGETVRRNNPCIYWGCVTTSKRMMLVNQPVLMGFVNKVVMEPRGVVKSLTLRTIKGSSNPTALINVYHEWLKDIE